MNFRKIYLLIILLIFLILGGELYFVIQKILNSKKISELNKISEINNKILIQPSNETSNTSSQNQESFQEKKEQSQIIKQEENKETNQEENFVLVDKLNSCTPYEITYKDTVFTGEIVELKILGIFDEKCYFVEKISNKFKIECKFSEDERKKIAQFFKKIENYKSDEKNSEFNLKKQTTTFNIEELINNPFQEAFIKGSCKISLYGLESILKNH